MEKEDEETIEFLKRSNLRCLFGYIYEYMSNSYSRGYMGPDRKILYIHKLHLSSPLVLHSEKYIDYPIVNYKVETKDYYESIWNRFKTNPKELVSILEKIFKPLILELFIDSINENAMRICFKVNEIQLLHGRFKQHLENSLIHKGLFIPYGS